MQKIDPVYWLLRLVVLRRFLKADLTDGEKEFVEANISKHEKVIWLTGIISACVVMGLRSTPSEDINTVILALLAPVMVMGGAWFAISFGGIPTKLLDVAMDVTFWLFAAFTTSLAAMLIAMGFIATFWLYPLLVLVYIGAIFSAIQYDTTDGLKAGLDEAMLKHSRAALAYYAKEGIGPDDEQPTS